MNEKTQKGVGTYCLCDEIKKNQKKSNKKKREKVFVLDGLFNGSDLIRVESARVRDATDPPTPLRKKKKQKKTKKSAAIDMFVVGFVFHAKSHQRGAAAAAAAAAAAQN